MPNIYHPWASSVPNAIDALVGLLTSEFSVLAPSVLVKDGGWTTEESAEQILSIGWSGFVPGYQYPSRSMSEQLESADVTAQSVTEGLGPSLREKFTVACASIVRLGEGLIPAGRHTAYANAAIVGRVIAPPNHTWNGTVQQSTMASAHGLHQIKDRRGALVVVTFAIEAQAYVQQ